jgi:hypothetical protein
MAGRSHTASSDQPNGIPDVFISQFSNPTERGLSHPHESQPEPSFLSVDSSSSLDNDTHTHPFDQGRPRLNAPLGAVATNPAYPNSSQRWNPAALLNPKGFQRSQQAETQGENLKTQYDNPSQSLFQFNSREGLATRHQYNGQGPSFANNPVEQIGRGVGYMVEQIHNVATRDFYPQKRRKTEENGDIQKANFGGSGGVLGEYVKERETQHEAKTNGTMVSVDLTGGKCSQLHHQ